MVLRTSPTIFRPQLSRPQSGKLSASKKLKSQEDATTVCLSMDVNGPSNTEDTTKPSRIQKLSVLSQVELPLQPPPTASEEPSQPILSTTPLTTDSSTLKAPLSVSSSLPTESRLFALETAPTPSRHSLKPPPSAEQEQLSLCPSAIPLLLDLLSPQLLSQSEGKLVRSLLAALKPP